MPSGILLGTPVAGKSCSLSLSPDPDQPFLDGTHRCVLSNLGGRVGDLNHKPEPWSSYHLLVFFPPLPANFPRILSRSLRFEFRLIIDGREYLSHLQEGAFLP